MTRPRKIKSVLLTRRITILCPDVYAGPFCEEPIMLLANHLNTDGNGSKVSHSAHLNCKRLMTVSFSTANVSAA